MTNDERKAVERAQATLSTMTLATRRDDAIVFDLLYASRLMTAATAKGIASKEALNVLRARARASNALDAVAVSLDRRTLTQDTIQAARLAVAALLDQASV